MDKSGTVHVVTREGRKGWINHYDYVNQSGPKQDWTYVQVTSTEGMKRLGQQELVCPHCMKRSYSEIEMNKHHFDNCKKKPAGTDTLDHLFS